jgi:hypothetical protein
MKRDGTRRTIQYTGTAVPTFIGISHLRHLVGGRIEKDVFRTNFSAEAAPNAFLTINGGGHF